MIHLHNAVKEPSIIKMQPIYLLIFILTTAIPVTYGHAHISWYICNNTKSLNTSIFTTSNNFTTHDLENLNCKKICRLGTVLASIIDSTCIPSNQIYSYRQLDNYPDIEVVGREYYTTWYIGQLHWKDFHVSTEQDIVSVVFHGINYKADIYMNGIPIINDNIKGMFYRKYINITEYIPHKYNNTNHNEPTYSTNPNMVKSGNDKDHNNDNNSNHSILWIALKVYPVEYPGVVSNGGQGGDHTIAKNAAVMQYTTGWDWIQPTPDRNTGIWNQVEILHSGYLEMRHMYMYTKDIDYNKNIAWLNSDVIIYNHHYSLTLSGELIISIYSPISHSTILTKTISVNNIKAHTKKTLKIQDIQLDNILLWWPHTHGYPYLYPVEYTLTISSHTKPSSISLIRMGIRKIEAYIDIHTQGWAFKVNNISIFLLGGNWIGTDQLLRYSNSDEISRHRYRQELTLHRDVGYNLIRVWGGGIAETSDFYSICDELGIFVHQDFWMTGDNNGNFAGNTSWPLDTTSYIYNLKDTILRLRPHPSLLLWVGGNELGPPNESPNRSIQTQLQLLLRKYDPTRFFIMSTMYSKYYPNNTVKSKLKCDDIDHMKSMKNGISTCQKSNGMYDNHTYIKQNNDNIQLESCTCTCIWYDTNYSLSPQDGPYGLLYPHVWYTQQNPGLSYPYDHISISYQPEVGSVSTPVYKSICRFMSSQSLVSENIPSYMAKYNEVHPEWQYYKYLPYIYEQEYDFIYAYSYPSTIPIVERDRINVPEKRKTEKNSTYVIKEIHKINITEYIWRSQLIQYQQYLSLYEGYLIKQFTIYSTVLFWKSQSPWPTLRGAIYDYYLDMTGGYWGIEKALSSTYISLSTDNTSKNTMSMESINRRKSRKRSLRDSSKALKLKVVFNPLTHDIYLINRSPISTKDKINVTMDIHDLYNTSIYHTILTYDGINGNEVKVLSVNISSYLSSYSSTCNYCCHSLHNAAHDTTSTTAITTTSRMNKHMKVNCQNQVSFVYLVFVSLSPPSIVSSILSSSSSSLSVSSLFHLPTIYWLSHTLSTMSSSSSAKATKFDTVATFIDKNDDPTIRQSNYSQLKNENNQKRQSNETHVHVHITSKLTSLSNRHDISKNVNMTNSNNTATNFTNLASHLYNYSSLGYIRQLSNSKIHVDVIQSLTIIDTTPFISNEGDHYNYRNTGMRRKDMNEYIQLKYLNKRIQQLLLQQNDVNDDLLVIKPIMSAIYTKFNMNDPSLLHMNISKDEDTVFCILKITCVETSPTVAFMIRLSWVDTSKHIYMDINAQKSSYNNSSTRSPPHKTDNSSDNVHAHIDPTTISDDRVLPTFYSINYITLRQQESVYITIATNIPKKIQHNNNLSYAIEIEGWNIPKQLIHI